MVPHRSDLHPGVYNPGRRAARVAVYHDHVIASPPGLLRGRGNVDDRDRTTATALASWSRRFQYSPLLLDVPPQDTPNLKSLAGNFVCNCMPIVFK